MKTKIGFFLLTSAFSMLSFAQNVTTVNATNSDISDNLDLRAVASIFGESRNLEDFEQRLNDPKMQISNLDLNNDNQVDYLRVIESVEGNAHLIILQAILDRDIFQDVATIEVEKQGANNVQVQVVGDVYMYGPNYIYEPVYVHAPIIFNHFWIGGYHPYVSSWYWNYYPSYYSVWQPYPAFRYRRNVNVYINVHNHYNYVNVRRENRAAALYNERRTNGYEREYPNRSFQQRHVNIANRHELEERRTVKSYGTRSNLTSNLANSGTRNSGVRNNGSIRENAATPREHSNVRNQTSAPRVNNAQITSPRENSSVRTQSNMPRQQSPTVTNASPRTNASSFSGSSAPTNYNSVRTQSIQSSAPRTNTDARTQLSAQRTPQVSTTRTNTNTQMRTGGNVNAGAKSVPSNTSQRRR